MKVPDREPDIVAHDNDGDDNQCYIWVEEKIEKCVYYGMNEPDKVEVAPIIITPEGILLYKSFGGNWEDYSDTVFSEVQALFDNFIVEKYLLGGQDDRSTKEVHRVRQEEEGI